MYYRLAVRNVRKSMRDYTIYFLTLTFGVCLFYVFNSIESQQAMMMVSDSQAEAMKFLTGLMGGVSVFISAIFGFLILYANRFLIRRRKKELGVYMTLGMKRGRISQILIAETALVGMFSFVVGLSLGIFFSQGLAVVTAKMFDVKLAAFRFIFSPEAAVRSFLYFGVAFVVVMVFNTVNVGRQKLIHLIYAERGNEKFKVPHLALSVGLFVLSIAILVTAYHLVLDSRIVRMEAKFWTSIVLGCVGTLLFFFSLSGFFLKVISQSRRIYLRDLNMFVLRQINSKIHTAYLSMTFVCLMLFFAICTLASGIGIVRAVKGDLNELTPFDASYGVSGRKEIYDEEGEYYDSYPIEVDIMELLQKEGIDLDVFAEEYAVVTYYDVGKTFQVKGRDEMVDGDYDWLAVTLSEYNHMLNMQGKPPLSLEAGEFAINSNIVIYDWERILADYASTNPHIEISGKDYQTRLENVHSNVIETTNTREELYLVVPDEAVEGLQERKSTLNINYRKGTDEYEELCQTAFEGKHHFEGGDEVYFAFLATKKEVFETSKMLSTVVSYLAIYIGVVFLITSAAVLAIAQLSEASDNVSRYGLLRKFGTERRMVNKALFMQILIYFSMPMLLAIVHSVIGIKVAGELVAIFGQMHVWGDAAITCIILVLVYGGYFVATYLGGKGVLYAKTK